MAKLAPISASKLKNARRGTLLFIFIYIQFVLIIGAMKFLHAIISRKLTLSEEMKLFTADILHILRNVTIYSWLIMQMKGKNNNQLQKTVQMGKMTK